MPASRPGSLALLGPSGALAALHSFPTRRSSDLTVEVLEHNGFHVVVPPQDCCGLPLQSNGNFPAARKYVRKLAARDRKSTRLNSSHMSISYAVFCLKKKTSRKTELLQRQVRPMV